MLDPVSVLYTCVYSWVWIVVLNHRYDTSLQCLEFIVVNVAAREFLSFRVDIRVCIHAVLSGTKYGLKQTRGKFGLGAKMVTHCFYNWCSFEFWNNHHFQYRRTVFLWQYPSLTSLFLYPVIFYEVLCKWSFLNCVVEARPWVYFRNLILGFFFFDNYIIEYMEIWWNLHLCRH